MVKDLITSNENDFVTGIAGVANVGDTPNWTTHHFGQANWYAFGRLAWNPYDDDDQITDEWIKTTWHCSDRALQVIKQMMMPTWMTFAQSHNPYAMGLTVATSNHFTADFQSRAGKYWDISKYSIGNDRTTTGSDYVSQYFEPNRSIYNNIETCPEKLLLSFHKVDWTHKMKSGLTLYEELMQNLEIGVELVNTNMRLWESIKDEISPSRFAEVKASLTKELSAARSFRNSAVDFFSKYAPAEAAIDYDDDLTPCIENNDFEYSAEGTRNPYGTAVRGVPYGWTAYVMRNGQEWWQTISDGVNTTALPNQSYGISQAALDIHDTNVCWFNTTPMPDDFKLYQTIPAEKLGKGKYRVLCTLACIDNKLSNARLYANNVSQYFGKQTDYGANINQDETYSFAGYTGCSGNDGDYQLNDMAVDIELEDGQNLELGIRTSCYNKNGEKATDNSGWFKVDYFRLYKLGGTTTNVSPATFQERRASPKLYNVAGQRLYKMQKGINIINNKKILL